MPTVLVPRAAASSRRSASRCPTCAATTCGRCSATSDPDGCASRTWSRPRARTWTSPSWSGRADLRYRGQSLRADRRGRRPRCRRGALRRGARAPLRLPAGGRGGRARQLRGWSRRWPSTGPSWPPRRPRATPRTGSRKANFDGDWSDVPVYRAAGMGDGFELRGPAIVEYDEATCVVRAGVGRRHRRRGDAGAGPSAPGEPRSRHPLRPRQRAVRHRRGDRRGADPRRLLVQHQGAPRLLDRALRRRRARWWRRPSTSPSTSARCPTRSPR